MKEHLKEFYLDWVNNFISVKGMALYYGFTLKECRTLIEIGQKYHEEEKINTKKEDVM